MYDEVMVNKVRLALEAVRFYADEFPFWQRHRWTGRPPTEERLLLAAFLVRQLFDLTFRETEGLPGMVAEYFSLETVPDYTTLVRKNASQRWLALWKRFHDFVMGSLPKRAPIIATDVSGYSGRKRSWPRPIVVSRRRKTGSRSMSQSKWTVLRAKLLPERLERP
jgi:hypothetical protein